MPIDFLSCLSTVLGAESVRSGINQGKTLKQMDNKLSNIEHIIASGFSQGRNDELMLRKLNSLQQDFSKMTDLILPQHELLVPQGIQNDKLLTDMNEIKLALKEIKSEYNSTVMTGQSFLSKEAENAMINDPWYFLKESRPLKGANLIKEGHIPIIYYYEGIKFVGWKEVKEIEYSFNFQVDKKTGLLVPKKSYNLRRNASCPCGSQKKYKHCCGKI